MRSTRRSHKPPQIRYFRCLVCGAQNPATKCQGRTSPGHIKTMYCFRCREDRDQEQMD